MGKLTQLQLVEQGKMTPEEAVEAFKVTVKNTTGRKFVPPSEEKLLEYYDRDEQMREQAIKAQVPFISDSSGFVLYPGLVLIGGVSGRGKSTLAANVLAGFLTCKSDGKALVVSNEESLGSIYNRIACVLLKLNFHKFHHGQYEPRTAKNVREVARDIMRRVTVCQTDGWDMSVMEDVQAMLVHAADSGASLALTDYYQTVNTSRVDPEAEGFTIHKRFGFWLKDFARRVPIPVVMFAQLKTDDEGTEIKDRVENDRTIVNHAFQVLEVCPDFDAKQSTFKMHKDRFGGQTNQEITMKFDNGVFVVEDSI